MSDQPTAAPQPTGRPIFIVGPMGSGTTLMRLIVDSHPNIAIAQETSIMRAYFAHRWIPFHKQGGEWYGRLGWSDDELDERMREFYSGMFERFAAQQGKARWGDKTPWHTWMIKDIARLFPDAVFIAMVRHPGAVAVSMFRRFRHSWGGAVGHWINVTSEQVQRGIELGDRLLLVRYEDLVTDPETTLREVFAWLDEPWSDRLLEHDKVHLERGNAGRVEGNARSDEPIDKERISTWAVDRSEHQMNVLARKAGALAAFYGYDVTRPDVFSPMDVPGSPRTKTLTGTDLATRKKAFPDLTDELEREITPWAGNGMLLPGSLGTHESTSGAEGLAGKPERPKPELAPKRTVQAARLTGRLAYRSVRKRTLRGLRAVHVLPPDEDAEQRR